MGEWPQIAMIVIVAFRIVFGLIPNPTDIINSQKVTTVLANLIANALIVYILYAGGFWVSILK